MNPNTYKSCLVPQCTNTTLKTPQKLFIHVPKIEKTRKKWLEMACRDPTEISTTTSLYFCEDHFNLPIDMENYMQYHIMGSVGQVIMKPGVLPTKFECQSNRSKRQFCSTDVPDRPFAVKRQKKTTEGELPPIQNIALDNLPSTSSGCLSQVEKLPKTCHKYIQVYLRTKFRSKYSQTEVQTQDKLVSPLKTSTRTISTSPFKCIPDRVIPSTSGLIKGSRLDLTVDQSDSDISYSPSLRHTDYPSSFMPSTDSSSLRVQETKMAKEGHAELLLQSTINKIKKRPRFYIGIPKKCFYLIDIISKCKNISEPHILLCLKKIRLDTKFSELADEFGISVAYASKLFLKNIPIIANVLRPFIVKIDKQIIKQNLPIAFRHKFYNVSCIIDCLEIEIQKPSKAVNQALTWSDYKKANTIKYLISCTPDGMINYISEGYGGRISDVCLVENCNFVDTIGWGACVLADRGFKHIEQLLLTAGCQLLRPPSVDAGSKMSKKEVRQTKQLASLRIHIERVIRRVREFSMLKPHACVNTNLIRVIDDVITIACGLINLQDSIIK